jgi:hypothetical protein
MSVVEFSTLNLAEMSPSDFDKGLKIRIRALSDLEPWIREAYRRIEDGQKVLGCKTQKQLCERHLNRTWQAVHFMQQGGNPYRTKTVLASSDDSKDFKTISSYTQAREPEREEPPQLGGGEEDYVSAGPGPSPNMTE